MCTHTHAQTHAKISNNSNGNSHLLGLLNVCGAIPSHFTNPLSIKIAWWGLLYSHPTDAGTASGRVSNLVKVTQAASSYCQPFCLIISD